MKRLNLKWIFKYLVLMQLMILYSCTHEVKALNFQQLTPVKYQKELPLENFAIAIKKRYHLPGLAIATIHKNKIKEVAVVGKNKTKGGLLLTKNSKFQIASCTKSFTALLVATFVSEGVLRWDTTLAEVFKDIPIHTSYREVTIRELLSHTAGLPQFWTDDEVFNIEKHITGLNGSIIHQRKVFTKWNLGQSPRFTKGEHHYSNGGYVIVASMLEKLTGKSYEALIEQRIFKPLKLKTAEFGYSFLKDTTQPYRHMIRDEEGIGITLASDARLPNPIFNPSGFISISINDFAAYVLFYTKLLMGKTTMFNYEVVREMFKPVIQTDGIGIGMGWQIIRVNGHKTYGHTGSDQSIRSAMSINPKTGDAVVFVTNIGDSISEMALVNVVFELINL